MDKAAERDALDSVYGAYATKAKDSESPDFLISLPGETHGVEVTELYHSPSDAKLQNLPTYFSELVDGKIKLHRSDRQALVVDDIVVEKGDGTYYDKVRAVIQTLPSRQASTELLFSAIASKRSKYQMYVEHASYIDLLVVDRGQLFGGTEELDYLSVSLAEKRSELFASPFREIFLLSRSNDGEPFFVPLRGSLLMVDVLLLDHAFLQHYGSPDAAMRVPAIATSLNALGHNISTDSLESVFAHGWEILVRGMDLTIRDWTTLMGSPHGEEALRCPIQAPEELVNCLTTARENLHSTSLVRLPARSTEATNNV